MRNFALISSVILTLCLILASIMILAPSCTKEEICEPTTITKDTSIYRPVYWADTLKILKILTSGGIVNGGEDNGKDYWMAAIYADLPLPEINYQNHINYNRVIIADTAEITDSSIFIITRIK